MGTARSSFSKWIRTTWRARESRRHDAWATKRNYVNAVDRSGTTLLCVKPTAIVLATRETIGQSSFRSMQSRETMAHDTHDATDAADTKTPDGYSEDKEACDEGFKCER